METRTNDKEDEMAQEVLTLSAFRVGKLTERVAMLERALIEERAELLAGYPVKDDVQRQHYYTLAENELVRAGLVRPKDVREMER